MLRWLSDWLRPEKMPAALELSRRNGSRPPRLGFFALPQHFSALPSMMTHNQVSPAHDALNVRHLLPGSSIRPAAKQRRVAHVPPDPNTRSGPIALPQRDICSPFLLPHLSPGAQGGRTQGAAVTPI